MSLPLYRLFTGLYAFSVQLVAPFNKKAQLWLQGRKNILQRMQEAYNPADKVIWVHCASLGEFEQGRPVIEQLKQAYPAYEILLTFFSPSGYEIRKDYTGAKYIYYLPLDTAENASALLDLFKPALVVFIKYEFWFYYLSAAKQRGIPVLLVSGIFRQDQPFFKSYGKLHRKMLECFYFFLVQNEESKQLLATVNLANVLVSGDTRFDRVVAIAEQFEPIEIIGNFCGNAPVVVAGSTWTDDDKELDHYANTRTNIRFIIAPHNINQLRLNECKKLYKHAIFFSELSKGVSAEGKNTLIIDNVGMLSRLYKYATVCYIGGGFGDDGIHNVLEAAVYGKPVVHGPVFEKYIEAVKLVELGGAKAVNTALELERTLDLYIQKGPDYAAASEASYNYVQQKKGATAAILQFIQEKRLLTR